MKHQGGISAFVLIFVLKLSSPTLAGDIRHCSRPEEAPAWAVPYGKEFWRRPDSAARPKAPASQTAVRISSSIDLGEVMERVSHAWVVDGETLCATVNAQAYTASFDGRGFRVSPHPPGTVGRSPPDAGIGRIMRASMEIQEPLHWLAGIESSPRIVLDQGRRPEARPALLELEARFRTVSVRRGNHGHYAVGQTTPVWSVLGNTAQALLELRSGLVEHYEARAEGIAVTWVLHKSVLGTGALTVEAEVVGLNYAGQTPRGHHFVDARSTARLCVGQVSVVDSSGASWQVETSVQDDRFLVFVPEDILREARYPLAIDPLISPEFGMDRPVFGPAAGDQSGPVAASNGTDYLVVWRDTRQALSPAAYETYGARVSADGLVLDPAGFLVSRHNGVNHRVASNGKDYLVIWKQDRMRGVRISDKGVVLDASELYLDSGWVDYGSTTLTSNGSDYLLVMSGRPDYAVPNEDVYAIRITSDGAVLDPKAIQVSTAPGLKCCHLGAVSDGRDYLIVWNDWRESSPTKQSISLYGARLQADGTVLDHDGIKISSPLRIPTQLAVATDSADYLVAWNSSSFDGDVLSARVSRDGRASTPSVVATNSSVVAAVSPEPSTYLVIWSGQSGLYSTKLDPRGVTGKPVKLPVRSLTGADSVANNGKGFLIARGGIPASLSGYDILGTVVLGFGADATSKDIAISTSPHRQRTPVIASQGADALVVWEDYRDAGGSGPTLYGTRINPGGKVLDPEGIPIAQRVSPSGFAVASNANGYLVVWVAGAQVFGARIDRAGVPLEPGSFAISEPRTASLKPSAVSNGSEYLVVWRDARNGSPGDIYGARISAAGTVLDPIGFSIVGVAGYQGAPTVASDGKDYLVVWLDGRRVVADEIFGARVESSGRVVDSSGFPICTVPGTKLSPSVAFNGTAYFVAWEDWRNVGSASQPFYYDWNSDVYGTWVSRIKEVFNPNGIPICTAYGRQSSPSIAANGPDFLRGEVLVVWQDGRNGASNAGDIHGARITEEGDVVDPSGFAVNAGPFDELVPAIACTGPGRFLVVSQGFRLGADRVLANEISLFESLVRRKGKTIVSWPAKDGTTYRIQFKDDLNAPVWNDLDGDVTPTNGTVSVVDEPVAGVPQRFYRLIEKAN